MSGFLIREPDVAGAVARCVNARALHGPTTQHPVACGWEDYPLEDLTAALKDFTAWADFDDKANSTGRHVLRTFAELPRDQQRALIEAAQAFPAEAAAEAAPVVEPPSADAEAEEPAWLR